MARFHSATNSHLKHLLNLCPTISPSFLTTEKWITSLNSSQQVMEVNMMKLSAQLERPHSPTSDSDGIFQAESHTVVPANLIATADGFEKKDHSWFAVSQAPTDLSIQIEDITFYIHKYPLVSRCGYFGRIEIHTNSNSDLKLDNFPGGPETLETILKFCYGLPITLDQNNVAALRCASEFLEMSEALEDGNLISKTEAFFTFVILSSWRDSIVVLKSCENLSPWAENLQIVRRCCDSIAWKISREAPTVEEIMNRKTWWFDDMATLRIDHFTRIMTALRAKGVDPEIIGLCIMQYAQKWLPNIESEREEIGKNISGRNELQWSIMSGKRQQGNIGHTKEQRMIVESLVSILPPQKEAVSCTFILKMLKMAILHSVSPALISELEKRAGLVLESANVKDLLIPSYATGDQGMVLKYSSTDEKTIHDIDVVQRILEYFLMYENQQQQQQPGPLAISKLLDNYLAEIAVDPKLSVTKFLIIAQALPANARTCDDGLYRAIDTYLKSHPSLSEHERRRLCKLMDCKKLSQDACAHAAQNDRLPLRTTIQVLFAEQSKIKEAIQGRSQTETAYNSEQEGSLSSTNQELKALKTELDKMKTQMAKMERDYTELQQGHEKKNIKQRNLSNWTFGWRKIRNSAFFNRKVDGEENEEHCRWPNQTRRSSLRRRESIS